MSSPVKTITDIAQTSGRQRLIDAALSLSAQKRSFSALGIREIAREAGLSAPAFYRHFADLNELGTALIEQVRTDVLMAFTDVRHNAAPQENLDIRPMLLGRFFEFVLNNPEPIIVGTCEAYGPLQAMRETMRVAMRSVAEDISEDLRIARLMPGLSHEAMVEVLTIITQNVFFMGLDYLEYPERRAEIFAKAERLVVILFTGALALADESNTA